MIWLFGMLLTQAAAVAIEPSGPWAISTTQTGCQIVRPYGKDQRIQIGFETYLTGSRHTLLFTAPVEMAPVGTGILPIILDDKDTINLHYGSFAAGSENLRVTKFFPNVEDLTKISNASVIAIGDSALPLRIGGAAKALNALDTCTSNLLASWGVDPALYTNHKMPIFTGNPGQWFTRESYPKEGRGAGRVILLLKTKADGSVYDCKAVASDDDSLNAGTCAIALKHLRVRAPTDAAGQPMASYTLLPIRWTKP